MLLRFSREADASVEPGSTVRIRAERVGDPSEVGFAAWAIGFRYHADILQLVGHDTAGAAPHMSQFWPRAGAAYTLNERDVDGHIVNDGEAQLLCFGKLVRGGTGGNPAVAPSPAGTLLSTLEFRALRAGTADVSFITAENYTRPHDMTVVYGNDRPNHALPYTAQGVTVQVGAAAPVDPEPVELSGIEAVIARVIEYGEEYDIADPVAWLEMVNELVAIAAEAEA
jgi:hypothetical protein